MGGSVGIAGYSGTMVPPSARPGRGLLWRVLAREPSESGARRREEIAAALNGGVDRDLDLREVPLALRGQVKEAGRPRAVRVIRAGLAQRQGVQQVSRARRRQPDGARQVLDQRFLRLDDPPTRPGKQAEEGAQECRLRIQI